MGRGNTTNRQMAAAARIQEQVGAVRSGQGQYVQGQFVTTAQLDDLAQMGVRPTKTGEQPTETIYLEDGRTGIAVTTLKPEP